MEILYQTDKKTVYKDGDNLVKLFCEGYPKSDILNEAVNQARVEEKTNLNIPKIKGVQMIDGKWAIISEYIEGETLAELMAKNPDKLEEYLNLFVDLQIEVSRQTVPMLSLNRDKMHAKISASSYKATIRYELHMRLDGLPKHKKLLHGDFCPENIVIKPDGTPCIIDWAHATQGNASADAARSYLIFCLQGRQDIADKYLKLFCEKTDTAIQYVQRIMPIVACSQSTKCKPGEKELLDRWVDVCDWQ